MIRLWRKSFPLLISGYISSKTIIKEEKEYIRIRVEKNCARNIYETLIAASPGMAYRS